MRKNQQTSFDPVIIVALGILLVAIAIVMVVFQNETNTISIAASSGILSQIVVAFVTGITTGGLSCQ